MWRLGLFACLVISSFSQKRPIQSAPARFAPFDAVRLQQQVESARSTVQRMLNSTKYPTFPTDVPHVYEDKYLLAEFLTNTEITAQLNTLKALGLSQFSLRALSDWTSDPSRNVSLWFDGTKYCTLRNTTSLGGNTTKRNEHIAMPQYVWSAVVYWRFATTYGPSETLLQQRNATFEFKTPTNQPPIICANDLSRQFVDVTWLFANAGAQGQPNFTIDRAAPTTFTPLRNRAVETALDSLRRLYDWSARVETSFVNKIFPLQGNMPVIPVGGLFVPVAPVLEASAQQCSTQPNCSTVLSQEEIVTLLNEQELSLSNATRLLEANLPAPSSPSAVSSAEGNAVMLLRHIRQVAQAYSDGVLSIEAVLQAQLVVAIGKLVKPVDIAAFMDFNNQLIIKPEFKPQDISVSVRRSNRDPDGVIAIERTDLPGSRPVKAFTRVLNSSMPMSMPIGRGTTLSFVGKRFVHGLVIHQFEDQLAPRLQLNARSFQFGSFVLVLGTLVSEDEFFPETACVIANKDRMLIPLLLKLVPNSIAFQNALSSLSPEQQAFAKRFREMQLSSTVFGFVVVQVKPLLERALKLPPESLTKEVLLFSILTQLITDYQVTTDQLGWSGQNTTATNDDKIAAITAQAGSIALLLQQIEANTTAKQNYVIQPLSQDYDYDYGPSFAGRQQVGGMAKGKTHVVVPNDPRPASAVGKGGASSSSASSSSSSSGNGKAAGGGGGANDNGNDANAPQPAPFVIPSEISDDDLISLLMLSPNAAGGSNPSQTSAASSAYPAPSLDFNSTATSASELASPEDIMRIPQTLGAQLGLLDQQHASGFVTIKPGPMWSQTVYTGLLATPQKLSLGSSEQGLLRTTALDLLYALSKSGALTIDAEIHTVFATTHAFEHTLLETVIQENKNPIAVLERINLILGSTIHNRSVEEIISPDQAARIQNENPDLFTNSSSPSSSS